MYGSSLSLPQQNIFETTKQFSNPSFSTPKGFANAEKIDAMPVPWRFQPINIAITCRNTAVNQTLTPTEPIV
jgi:hypothetical protein